MLSATKRFFTLLSVFVLFFLLVTALRTWRAGGDLASLIPSFLSKAETIRSDAFTPSEKSALNLSDVELISRLNQEYARLTNAVVPSVVSIDTKTLRTNRMMDFWGRTQIRSYPIQGQGSGVIVSKEGHIITNHHVIAGQPGNIRVTLHNGKKYEATIIGEDRLLDIAVIKINSNETFKPLKLGDSSLVKVGQLVFAIGNPFGLGETVTQGIISATERSLSGSQSDNQPKFFQTDAAINPGNSGGPLVNLTGEIIGINAAIFSVDKENPSFQGVGFSIPSNDVKDALEKIIKGGRSVRGYLGVRMSDLDSAVRAELGYEGAEGSAVFVVEPGSPAELAGLKVKDIVLKYNGTTILSTEQLISLVQHTEIGSTVIMEIWREGEVKELECTIVEAKPPAQSEESSPFSEDERNDSEILDAVGLKVRSLTKAETVQGFQGVFVVETLPTGVAQNVLFPGDLIIALNNLPISDSKEFYLHLSASAAVQATSFHLIRNGRPIRVSIPPPR